VPPTSDDLAVLDQLAEDFVDRLRRGERPPIQTYSDKNPKLAADIERLFPTLVAMERLGSSTEPTQPVIRPSEVPERIGGYRIIRVIGEGGMGLVYEAVEESLGRHVALKVLPSHARLSERFRERFTREARAAARLHHPHIVPVFNVGEDRGTQFYAMQFIRGRALDSMLGPRTGVAAGSETVSLGSAPQPAEPTAPVSRGRTALDTGPAHFRWVAEVGAQVADALAYAHEEGVIHRDVKPSNLLLDDHGAVWVTDFGLAKTTEAEGLTAPGDIVGTLRYMAPERFSGWSDARSDVYGLGATLFELLTGRPMFDDPDRGKLIHAILQSDPPRPRKLNRNIPRDLETIVLKATAREPGHRYASAQALAGDLRRFLAGLPIHARRHSPVAYAWRWCKRKPFAAITSGLLAVSLLALLVGSIVVNIWLDDRKTRLENARTALYGQLKETEQARARERDAERQAREQLMRALHREAEAALWSRRPGSRAAVFDALQQIMALSADFPLTREQTLELRNLAVASFALLDVHSESSAGPPIPPQSRVMPDGVHYAVALDGGLDVVVIATGQRVARLTTIQKVSFFVISPDSRYLIVRDGNRNPKGDPHTLVVWDWQANKRLLSMPGNFEGHPCAVRADSREMAACSADGTMSYYSLPDFSLVRQFRWPNQLGAFAYNPTGDRVAAMHWKSRRLEVRDVANGDLKLAVLSPPETGLMKVAWSPDGRLLAAGCSDFRAYIWSADNGRRISDLVGHQAEVVGCDFGPDAAWIATTSWDGMTRFWDPITGVHLLTVPGSMTTADPGRRWLAVTTGTATTVLHVDGQDEAKTLHAHVGGKGPWHVAFDPKGRILASASVDAVRFWDAPTGRAIGELSAPGGAMTAIFHPDGKSLLACGHRQCSRWPIEFDGAMQALRIGPRESLLPEELLKDPRNERRAALSADGSRLVVTDQYRGRIDVIPLADPALRRDVPGLSSMAGVAMSPDDRWVVGLSWPNSIGRIVDVADGTIVKFALGPRPVAGVGFSPDGRRLFVGSERGGEVLETGTWKKLATIPKDATGTGPGLPAVSSDGRVLAVTRRGGREIQLLDAWTLRELTRLVSADPQPITHVAFSSDGRRLAAACTTHVVQAWDLGRIRERLSELNLDWNHPPYPEPATAGTGDWRMQVAADPAPPAKK
jgi:serine/threonine protein kinase/WD40 repeat protein